MREPENIRQLIRYTPDYIGFIFYPGSPRYAGDHIPEIHNLSIPEGIQKVGVFVNEDIDTVFKIHSQLSLDVIQLHGKESVKDCIEIRKAGLKVAKVFSVGADFDFKIMKPYADHVDFFLFDTKGKYYGGNSLPFDWQVLEDYPYERPFILGGGIGIDNVAMVSQISSSYLYGLDANSQLEQAPGLKDMDKIKTFKEQFDKIQI